MQTNPEPRRVSTQTMVIAGLAALLLFLLGILLGNLIGSGSAEAAEPTTTTVIPTTSLPETTTTSSPTTTTTVAPTTTTLPTTTTTTLPTATTSAPTTTTTSGPSPELHAAVDYFIASQEICQVYAEGVGETPPDPARYVGVNALRMVSNKQVLIRDGLGDHVIVDLGTDPATIYSEDGPDGMLPFDLIFGCPPDIYVGTWH